MADLTAGKIPKAASANTIEDGYDFKDEDDLHSDSASAVASQQSIKKYVDDNIIVPASHKDSHDPEDGGDPLDCAAAGEIVGVAAAAEGTAHTFARSDHTHQIQHSIANNHVVTIDDADAANGEFCKFTASGIEGRATADVLTDLNVADGADVTGSNAPQAHKDSHDPNDGGDALDCAAAAEISVVVAAGEGSAHSFARSDHVHAINHAITDNHIVTIDDADAANGEFCKFTANGIEGKAAAVASDINTGTDTAKPLTADALAGSNLGTKNVVVKCIADDTELTTGNGKAHFTVPIELNGMNLVSVGAHVYTVSSSGLPSFQIHNLTDTQDMLSTNITIDESEYDSKDADTAAVIDTDHDDVSTGDVLRFDCDAAGTDTCGMELRLSFRLP